jgi:hypothetical protein
VNKFKFNLDLIDQSLAQDRFAEFVRQAWPIVEPATVLVWNWHLDALCEYLEVVAADDGIKRLIINIPPRSGKSLLASVLWPAWVRIRRPATRWLFASYSASLSTKHNLDRRAVLMAPWFQRRWPIRLAADQNQKTEFRNAGHMIATSIGGTATGKGGDFIVVDDLQDPTMADSEVEREKVVRFFDETLSTRLDDNRHGRIVVIQQRTHQADLTGHLLEQGGWTHLCLPAEFERKTVIALPLSDREIVKQEGDLLWPEREGRAELGPSKIGSATTVTTANTCRIRSHVGGNLFKLEWFGTFVERPKLDLIVRSWDTAYKTAAANDYSACVTIRVIRERREDSGAAPGFYVLHAWSGKIEFFELKRRAVEFNQEWHPAAILVEDAASGTSLA